ncbi:MAG: hypothetical protein JWL99_3877, partial [Streptomyces oryziradicis]|nr:hypothetical protein [Actinacidiphila oryziradicis]
MAQFRPQPPSAPLPPAMPPPQ